MNIQTKYNPGDYLFFIKNGKKKGDVSIRPVQVLSITAFHSNGQNDEITYKVKEIYTGFGTSNEEHDIEEDFLYQNEGEILAFFKGNIRSFLNKNKEFNGRVKEPEKDDLPF
jgi:hypothetical protein